jgi:hypothetical protein
LPGRTDNDVKNRFHVIQRSLRNGKFSIVRNDDQEIHEIVELSGKNKKKRHYDGYDSCHSERKSSTGTSSAKKLKLDFSLQSESVNQLVNHSITHADDIETMDSPRSMASGDSIASMISEDSAGTELGLYMQQYYQEPKPTSIPMSTSHHHQPPSQPFRPASRNNQYPTSSTMYYPTPMPYQVPSSAVPMSYYPQQPVYYNNHSHVASEDRTANMLATPFPVMTPFPQLSHDSIDHDITLEILNYLICEGDMSAVCDYDHYFDWENAF